MFRGSLQVEADGMNLRQVKAEDMNLVGFPWTGSNTQPLQAEAPSSSLIAPEKKVVFLVDLAAVQRRGSRPAALQSPANGAGWTVLAASLLAHGIEAATQPLAATTAVEHYHCNPQAEMPRTKTVTALHHPKFPHC
jgi:hypothetical protein